MTEDEIVGCHHRLNGHGFEQIPGDNEGQGSLACCSPWEHNESDVTHELFSLLFRTTILIENKDMKDV